MDREEIIKLAREVGYPLVEYEGTPYIPPLLAVLLKAVATPRRPWVGLTEDEAFACKGRDYFETYKAIEAKLKDKNT